MKEEEEERERKIGFGGESAMEAVMFGFGTFALVTRLRHAFFLGGLLIPSGTEYTASSTEKYVICV